MPTQDNRVIAIDTPLGKDVLLLQGLMGTEAISQLFRFELDLASESESISFKDIVGQRVTIRVSSPERDRHVNGFVSRFTQSHRDGRFTYYRAEVVPWLWFLTRKSDCRIFQEKTVPDIVTSIFDQLGFRDYTVKLTGTYEPRQYCVQYRETDFNFVSRLLEENGISYYFQHEDGKHTLVLADSPDAYDECPGRATFWYEEGVGGGADVKEGVVSAWETQQELKPGKYALTDYNFENPSTSLLASIESQVKVGGNDAYERFDYPGEYLKKDEGERLVRLRIEEEETLHFVNTGRSNCRPLTSGYAFKLEGHYRPDLNQKYTLVALRHHATVGAVYQTGQEEGEGYSNDFSCIPKTTPFRPQRTTPAPIVQGVQTAMVVGPPGEEIHTDKYGRVKVQFHWDRQGKHNENSSCWIRVSQPWAGKGWGSISIPRIGQEVIVDFVEGDPDQPIITGRVYNGEQMPPQGLPAAGVISGWKSKTHKGAGYNEMSMDDTTGKEKVTIHAQYDMNTTIEHDETHTVKTGNRTIAVETGKHTETIKGDTAITIQTGNHSVTVQTGKQDTSVKQAITITSESASIYVHAATNIQLHTGASKLWMASDGNISLEGVNVTIKGTSSVTVKGGVVHSEADAEHQTKGAIVISEGSATNTVKGGMVMLNP